MTKFLKSNNFIISLIVSLIIASFVTFIFDKNNTERFYKKLEISNLLSQDLLVIQKLKMAINYDPFISKLDIFARDLNYLAYDQNSDCGKINRINNVVPIVISVRKNSIIMEVVGDNKNTFDSCINSILNEVKKENLKTVEYYNELIIQFIDNRDKYESVDQFILMYENFKNEAEKKVKISEFTLAELYNIYLREITFRNLNISNLAPVSIQQLEYWRTYIDDQRVDKPINLYIIFCGSLILFIILFQILSRNLYKNSIINSLKKFFN